MEPPGWLLEHPYMPKNADKGDPTPIQLYLAVGRITHSWECLEHLFQILFAAVSTVTKEAAFRWASSPPNTQAKGIRLSAAPMLAYGAVVSPQSRMAMLEAAANSFSSSTGFTQTADIAKSVIATTKRLVGLRNIAAHGVVAKLDGNEFTVVRDDSDAGEFYLLPAFYNMNKNTSMGVAKYWFNSATLAEVEAAIWHLAYRVQYELIAPILAGFDGSPIHGVVRKPNP